MKISISGSHSTGKTLLVNSCYNRLEQVYPTEIGLINEIAREVISRGFTLNQNATCESYYNYIQLQLERERNNTRKYILSDRSLVDLLAYIRTNNDPKIPSYFIKMVEEIVWVESKFFDLYCYLPIEFTITVDDVRPEDEGYRSSVDKALVHILHEYKLDFIVAKGNLEERVNSLITIFNRSL